MGLNNMELGDSTLKVQRASIGMRQAAGVEMGVNAMAMMAGTTSADLEASRVLQLLNMVTPEELMDPEEYDGIFLSHCAGLFLLLTASESRNLRRHS